MSTIAKGMITLSSLNDAFNVSLSPNSCVIHADFDGTNPKLDGAYTNVTITRGDTPVKFNIKLHATSNQSVQYDIVDVNEYTKRIKLTSLPSDILSGFLEFEIQSFDDFFANITFQFTVVRESTMLDWIQDWENNKTTIGSTYMITPKIFVGKKIKTSEDLESLSGVYIGPDSLNGAGVYGYVDGAEIFHLNQNGGMIGGWQINNGGIQTSDGKLKILSEGSILSHGANNNVAWALYKTGDAVFANGNVKMFANGNAEFIGAIKTKAGEIGGWNIKQGYLSSQGIRLDAIKQKISVFASAIDDLFTGSIETVGGVEMFFDSANSYGIECYLPATQDNQLRKSFSLGASNYIAGWMFDDTAIWLGAKLNTAKQYTSQEGSITIGTAGLRGNSWYIDANGDFSLMAGKINFSASQNGGDIVGWKLNNNRLSTDKVAIVSDGSVTGIYLTASSNSNFNSLASTALGDAINTNGGICLNVNSDSAELRAHNSTGQRLFQLKSNGTSYIASWEFDKDAIYTGVKVTDFSKFSNAANCITLSPNGLVGFKWRLLADGSGALANGNISWTTAGAVTFSESVKINWSNLGGTIIDGNGIFAGKISANNITAGTISTANIKNSSGTWHLNQDGSGALANGNISWTTAGNVALKNLQAENCNLKNIKINGTIRQPWSQSGIYINVGGGESLTYDNIAAGASGGWGDGSANSMVTWTLADSGRIIRVANWRWGSQVFDGKVTFNAPTGSGKYFFEDGVAKTSISLSREVVELMGYGDSSTFYGWIVLNRINFNTTNKYGRKLLCLAMGTATYSNGSISIKYKTFDNSTLSISRSGDGIYTMFLPSAWNLEADGYQVMMTGLGGGLIKATLSSQTSTSCEIHVSDDASRNDGSFQFQIFNINDWV